MLYEYLAMVVVAGLDGPELAVFDSLIQKSRRQTTTTILFSILIILGVS